MTDLKITQAAREAAAALISARPSVENPDIILHGGGDDGAFVQAFQRAMSQAADALDAKDRTIERLRELLLASTERMEATLAAMDRYNERNGTAIIGPSLLGLGAQIAHNHEALKGQTP